jgi:hypothetical protein
MMGMAIGIQWFLCIEINVLLIMHYDFLRKNTFRWDNLYSVDPRM